MDVLVKELGAVGDGACNDTQAFTEAMRQCSASGGGKVIVEPGCYRLGVLRFFSNVELHLQKGARLLASDHLEDFDLNVAVPIKRVDTPTWDDCDYDGKPTKFFIYAYQCKHISITGEGIIDGNEEIFYGTITKWHIDGFFYPRVPLIYFEDCEYVTIEGVKLTRSAFWTTHLVGCRNVLIQNIIIDNNLRLANCDGIDPDHCQNVTIRNCYISSADDCIVFKTTSHAKRYGPCEHILVEGCTLISTSAAIKFGTESVSDFRDIKISNCRILNSNRGICLQLRDEGSISDVSFEHISIETRRFSPVYWWGKSEPIILTAIHRNATTRVGSIHNISFFDIQMNAENGIFIYGEHRNIYNIQMKDIHLLFIEKTDWPKNTYDLRPSEYGILEGPNYPLYLHSCEGITLQNWSYELLGQMKEEMIDEIYLKDVADIHLNDDKLIDHLDDLHSTIMGYERIYKNTGINDVVVFIKEAFRKHTASVLSKGKNYYILIDNFVFTIHRKCFTIITAHKRRTIC